MPFPLGLEVDIEPQPSSPLAEAPSSHRWILWACVTGLANIVALFLYPQFITGCSFQVDAAIVAMLPLAWGLYPYLRYRTLRERIVGYIGMALAIPWFWQALQQEMDWSLPL
ncbi:MAG: hypothetical protein ACYSU0_05555 [Planctomycetota bacterium]